MIGNSATAATWATTTTAAAGTAAAGTITTTTTTWAWLWLRVVQALYTRNCLSHRAASPLGRLLKVLLALDIFGQAFFFAELLKSTEHLID
jgi:hypothetical protein